MSAFRNFLARRVSANFVRQQKHDAFLFLSLSTSWHDSLLYRCIEFYEILRIPCTRFRLFYYTEFIEFFKQKFKRFATMRFWALERFFFEVYGYKFLIFIYLLSFIHVINLYSFLYFYIRFKKHLKTMYFDKYRILLYPSSCQGFPRNFPSFSNTSVAKNATNFPNTLTESLPFLIWIFLYFIEIQEIYFLVFLRSKWNNPDA